MSVWNIVDHIIEQAEKQAEKVREEWKAEIDKIKQINEETLLENWLSLKKRFENKKKWALDKAKSMAILEWKNKVLKSKHNLINNIFSLAKENILNLPHGQYLDILVKLLKNIKDETWELIPWKWEKEILTEANNVSKKSFTIKWEWKFKWWFRLITKISDYDFSFDNIFNEIKKEKWLEISNKLFN